MANWRQADGDITTNAATGDDFRIDELLSFFAGRKKLEFPTGKSGKIIVTRGWEL